MLAPLPPPRFRKTRLMSDEFHRIHRPPPYVFAEVNAAKARARGTGENILDLGIWGLLAPGSNAAPQLAWVTA